MKGLGRVYNVVAAASGVHIPLTNATAVSFVTFLDAGTQIATIKESVDGASEQALDCNVYPHKAPGVGGTWTAMAEQDDTLDLSTDAVNDCMVFTVGATQLSDGFNCVEVTVSGGICIAITHDLAQQRKPANLPRNVV
ncbi:hypothetical protein [Streptomyces sp. H27-C3]|uniref:hypothetical protein n=1 Tax=Streptomyces sp. H27-C3 TaxID=3046305 RepID=UPI0024BADB9F|nr:hypothetical protein [Streptomyces sp. H27-C3]MDJ0460590.1 hypothetical protein [Streptomyces sp. H27-C3]